MTIGESLVMCICVGLLSPSGGSIINVSVVALPCEKLHTGNRRGISINVIYILVTLIICRVMVQTAGITAEI